MKKIIFVPAILFAIAVVFFSAGCSQEKNSAPAVAPVLVVKATATNVPVEIQPSPIGHVVAYSSVTMRPQVGGILQQIHFKEGAEVKSNTLLFTIDPRPSQAA